MPKHEMIDATAASTLTRDERSRLTAELLERAHATPDDDRRELLDRVVVMNLRVAKAIASRYRMRGVPLEDLEQAACVGLIKAVRRFDPALHHDLLSYAVPTIRGEVQRYFRDLSWSVRPPRRIQELQAEINRTSSRISQELGREPTDAELCEVLEVDRAEYDEAVSAFGCFQPPSLDQPVGRDASSNLQLGDAIVEQLDDFAPAEARTMLAPAVRELPERDRRVLYLRFVKDRTQREIGEEFGVGQMQVSRWLSRIFATLRDVLEAPTTPRPRARPA